MENTQENTTREQLKESLADLIRGNPEAVKELKKLIKRDKGNKSKK